MSEQRRPGRPQIADPDRIVLAAVSLFAERGYDSVTMDDVAAASGISRRTLFRHFASKAELVWRDFFLRYERVREQIELGNAAPGMDGLRSLVRAQLDLDDEAETSARVRMRIVGTSSEVFAAGVGSMDHVVEGLSRHFAGGADQVGLEARVAGQAALAAILEASVWWAANSDDAVGDVVDRALAGVGASLA